MSQNVPLDKPYNQSVDALFFRTTEKSLQYHIAAKHQQSVIISDARNLRWLSKHCWKKQSVVIPEF